MKPLLGTVACVLAGLAGTVHGGPPRIVSLAPHLSELVFEAGAGAQLVGAVEFSDYPAEVRAVPRIGDAFRVDRERIAALDPEVILAWQGGTAAEVVGQLRRDGYRVEVLAAYEPEDVAGVLARIGEIAGTGTLAADKADRYLETVRDLRARYATRAPVRVFYQVSVRPLYTVNSRQMIGRVITLCGGRNVFAGLSALSPVVSREAVLAADPQVILTAAPEGLEALGTWRRYPDLAAVAGNHLYALDPDVLVRPTLRLAAGIRAVCEALEDARTRAPGSARVAAGLASVPPQNLAAPLVAGQRPGNDE